MPDVVVIYRVNCIEKPSQNPNTGNIYYAYILTDIQKIEIAKEGRL
jgi:hypothetical protein